MSGRAGPARAHLDSARLRALAHPLRSRLLAALRLDGPSTSAGLAERLGTNTGATSYHLRRLADVGLIEEEPDRGTARERWWRAAHEITSWSDADFDDDPDDRAAATWLLGQQVRVTSRWVEDWLAARDTWPEAWRRAASLGDARLRLTAEEAAELGADLWAVIERHREVALHRQDDEREAHPDAVADVMVLVDVFPTRGVRL